MSARNLSPADPTRRTGRGRFFSRRRALRLGAWGIVLVACAFSFWLSHRVAADAVRLPGRLSLPGPVFSLFYDPGPRACVYAGVGDGLYRSQDGGQSWRRIFRSGFSSQPVRALHPMADVSSELFFSAGARLFRWSPKNQRCRAVYRAPGQILSIAMDPADSGRILLGTDRGVVLADGRQDRWMQLQEGGPTGRVKVVYYDARHPEHCYAFSQQGFFRSTDGGSHWCRVWALPSAEEEAGEPVSEEALEEEPLARSLGWAIDPREEVFYVGTSQGVYRGTQGGQHWEALSAVGLGAPEVTALLVDPENSDLLYAATGKGLFVYSACWGAWRPLGKRLPDGPIYTMAMAPEGRGLWVGTEQGLFQIPAPAADGLGPPPSGAAGPFESSSPFPVRYEPGISRQAGPPPAPAVQEVLEEAIRYAEVSPTKIRSWRRLAQWRAWIPRFTIGVDRDESANVVSSTRRGETTFTVGPARKDLRVKFNFTWDLADLVWNPDQTAIDARSRLMVQLRQDLLAEVTRLYFERERLLAEFSSHPTEDPLLAQERRLRVEELTAHLDALTGGWFSDQLSVRPE